MCGHNDQPVWPLMRKLWPLKYPQKYTNNKILVLRHRYSSLLPPTPFHYKSVSFFCGLIHAKDYYEQSMQIQQSAGGHHTTTRIGNVTIDQYRLWYKPVFRHALYLSLVCTCLPFSHQHVSNSAIDFRSAHVSVFQHVQKLFGRSVEHPWESAHGRNRHVLNSWLVRSNPWDPIPFRGYFDF